jgi:hypothetical protein
LLKGDVLEPVLLQELKAFRPFVFLGGLDRNTSSLRSPDLELFLCLQMNLGVALGSLFVIAGPLRDTMYSRLPATILSGSGMALR